MSYEISLAAQSTHGVRPVVGASGWSDASSARRSRRWRDERGVGAMIVPNFSIGAMLMMRFAEEAARYFPDAEIVEMHHDRKKDAPVGNRARDGRTHHARRRTAPGRFTACVCRGCSRIRKCSSAATASC